MKLKLNKDMVARLNADRPDSRERDATKQASKISQYKAGKLDLAQRQLMVEVERAVHKRDTLGTKVKDLASRFKPVVRIQVDRRKWESHGDFKMKVCMMSCTPGHYFQWRPYYPASDPQDLKQHLLYIVFRCLCL